jgi:cysteine synthase A
VAKTVTAPPYCAELRHVYPARVPTAVATELTGMVSRVLTAAGIRDGATHTELRRGAGGCSVIEVNCRPAGGMIPELIRLVDGVDILEQQLRWAAGLPVDLTRNRRGAAGIQFVTAAETGVLEDVRGVAEARAMPGVCDVAVTAPAGAEIRPPRSAYDRLGYVIARGAGPAEVTTRLAAATARLAVTAQPIARRPELIDAGGS